MVQFYCRWRGKFEIENSSRSWLQRSGAVYLEAATALCSNVAAVARNAGETFIIYCRC